MSTSFFPSLGKKRWVVWDGKPCEPLSGICWCAGVVNYTCNQHYLSTCCTLFSILVQLNLRWLSANKRLWSSVQRILLSNFLHIMSSLLSRVFIFICIKIANNVICQPTLFRSFVNVLRMRTHSAASCSWSLVFYHVTTCVLLCSKIHYQLAIVYWWLKIHRWSASPMIRWFDKWRFYVRQGGYVIVIVCLCVCLSVSNFVQKLLSGFAWNFQGRLAMGQWTND